MPALVWLLVFLGPFLVVSPLAVAAEINFPGLFKPPAGPRPRPVTRPRPTRWTVA